MQNFGTVFRYWEKGHGKIHCIQSVKKMVNVTVHFITEFSLNLSIHISSLFVSLFERYTHLVVYNKEILQKRLHWRQKNNVRRRRMNYLVPLIYLLKRYIRWLGRINQISKNDLKKCALRMVRLEQSMLLRKSM